MERMRQGALAVAAIAACAAAAIPGNVRADAIVRTQAMFATTIAEYFIEDEHVRVELEIGVDDVPAFRNLLPDEFYERLGVEPSPLADRLELFFSNDLVITASDVVPISGRMVSLEARRRVQRDEISGEPIPPEEGAEEEIVIFARLEYPLSGRPAALTFFGPRGGEKASVGFVAYHRGVPLNDFRYLAASQTLDLDWSDPWYSSFRSRILRRTYFAPMYGFVYVEPYEVRKEIVVRPRDLQRFVDLGLEGRNAIPVEIQGDLKRTAAEFLRGHQKVEIDGLAVEPELARVNFLERTLRTSRVVDPPVELDLDSAVLGVIFAYPTEGLPQRVTMDWDLWDERIQRVPAASVDQAGPLPVILEPDFRVLEWQNFLKNPELPTLRVLELPPSAAERAMLPLRWVLLVIAIAAAAHWARARGRKPGIVAVSAAFVAVAGFALSERAALTDERAAEVVSGVLHNVYRAFDFRGEEQIYDVLAQSVDGELLGSIYLETRRGLVLANQGGARAKVKQIELVELVAEPGDGGGFRATATWNVSGSIGHWGHIHRRDNQYRARLGIAPVEGVWKLVDLEILEQQRVAPAVK
jgi:hypothetical protein